ncbi:hypothetical protein HPB50_028128 [Hyalomma asiaticum]|nr:hypothetical protein HPB50_028128 [Hyalomma asiaticum]
MFALVRLIEDDMDKRQYVIPVSDIEDFHPVHENDFSNRTAYRARWHDPDNDENDGTYAIQILRLADTEEDMEEKMRQKRVNIPPINMSDVENESDDFSQKKKVLRLVVKDMLEEMPRTRADFMHTTTAEFTSTSDGFHLCKGVIISGEQATKIFNNKKATIVVRDSAQAIWGQEALARRTVSGRSVPGEDTKQLTPEKVQVVKECLAYWERTKKEDVTVTAHGLQRILSEKIQDVKKKMRQAKA